MVVLIADALAETARATIQASGHEVIYEPSLKAETLTEQLRQLDPAVLIVRSTKVTAADLAASPGLELIVRAGAGVDSIDVAEASRRGVFVANCPGKNATAVAELAFGLLLALDRRIPDNVQEARAGRWNKKGFASGLGLYGQTLGLIGLGSIGR
ncbi:MAG: NAD(P)-dependent oxidoreductase, partial [Bacteroidota bacterium]